MNNKNLHQRGKRKFNCSAIASIQRMASLLILAILLAGCGNNSGDSRSGGGGSEITTSGSSIQTMITKTTDASGESVAVEYTLRNSAGAEVSGFIRFGDGAEIRVSGTGVATYLYPQPGRYQLSVQVDGDDSQVIGEVTIERASQESQGIPACTPNVEQSSGECFVT